MAITIKNESTCNICGLVIEEEQNAIVFPAFLERSHELHRFSDGVFHETCFNDDPRHESVNQLFAHYREIWENRPSGLSLEEIEQWGKEKMKPFR